MADDEFATAVADVVTEAVPSTPEAPVEQETPTEPPKEPEKPDPRDTELEALRKTVNDLKSQNTGRQSASQRQAELLDEVGSLKRTVAAFLSNQVAGGDVEELGKELAEIDADTLSQAETRAFEANLEKATALLSEAVSGSGLDPAGAELANARTAWTQAKQDKNPAGLYEAVAFAHQAVLQAERRKIAEAAHAPIGTKPEESEGDGADALAMATSSSASAASISDRELYRQYGRGEISRTPELVVAAKRLGLPI